jgi:hypothetical protein
MGNYPHQQPPTRFSWWDVLGVASYTTGTVLNVIDDGFRMLSRVFFAAGEDSRIRRDQREYEQAEEASRQRLSEALEAGAVTFDPKDLL